jgi:signal transduction histidine kinase/DNA-binding response OmpR family regulator
MLKKQLRSRLDNLFTELENKQPLVPVEVDGRFQATGWTWECDSHGAFTFCSPEVEDCLGIRSEDFLHQSLYTFQISPQSIRDLARLISQNVFPCEIEVQYYTATGNWAPVRMTVFSKARENGEAPGWSGYNQVIPSASINQSEIAEVTSHPNLSNLRPPARMTAAQLPFQVEGGVSIKSGIIAPASGPWTTTASLSLQKNQPFFSPSQGVTPATMAIPFQVGDRNHGLVEIIDDSNQRQWSEDDRLLAQEVAKQLALALENAFLYTEVRNTLSALENRERYQSNIAKAISLMTESGTKGLQGIVQTLGEASQCGRVYFAELIEDSDGIYWRASAEWLNPKSGYLFENSKIHYMPVALFPYWSGELKRKGWASALTSEHSSPEREFLEDQGITSILILAVQNKSGVPSFLAFEEIGTNRVWLNEEISALLMAANGLSNTIAREDLMGQVQVAYEQAQTALLETEQLYKVSEGITQAENPQDLVILVAKTALPAKADRVSLLTVTQSPDNEITSVEIIGYYDREGEYQRVGLEIPALALPILKRLTNEMLVYPDVATSTLDPISKKTLLQLNVHSCVATPLRVAGRLTGILMISSRKIGDIPIEDIRILQVAANGISVAMERQRLLKEAQRRALELQTAAEIARDTTSTLTLDLLLDRMVNLLCERFKYYHASIFLLDDTGTYAVIRESVGEAGKDMKQRGYKLAVGSKSIIGTVTATGKPVIVNDVTQSQTYYPNPLLPDTHSEMGLALKLADRIIGAVDLQSTRVNTFTPDDVAVMQILADQIAVAIDNARSYELTQKAVAEMQEIDRLKSQFLANMSHELRTPLNSIIGFSRVILKGIDGPINEVQKQDLGAIYNSGHHLLALITDILDLSKLEAGKMELSFSEVNMGDLINSAMSTAAGLVKDKSIKLNHIVPANLPMVMADAIRVRQVLLNLVSNASKFTDEGSITIEAFSSINQDGKPEIMVTVTDTGVGIAGEDRGKLFQPFSQVDDSPTRKTGGTGLGLSICKSLIEMHGGKIGLLNSEIGKGSTFFFTLPLPIPEPEPEPEIMAHGLVIMAIDDDEQVISLYERYLKPQGYFVVPVTDPTQAVLRAKEIKPFAITLDIMMPVRDGWDVLKDLKNNPETHDIPIIICSILEEEERGFSLGAADYLVKPFLQEDIIKAITRLDREGTIHKVLVIDDDPADLRLVQKILEDMSEFEVMTANGGKSGWEAITTNHPDAIILDLFMPGLNGFSILENLRKEPELRNIPVIILTGADLTPEQHQQLSDYGMHFLTKGLLRENELLNTLGIELKKIPRS